MRLRLFRGLLGILAAVTLMFATTGQTMAMSVSNGRQTVGVCTTFQSWTGAAYWGQSYGTMRWCKSVYKLASSDKSGDYYAVVVWGDVNTYSDYGNTPVSVTVRSTLAAKDNYYQSSPSINGVSCSATPVNISLSVAGVGIGLQPILCTDSSIYRGAYGTTQASWSTPNLEGVEHWESAYIQKVSVGSVPSFTVSAQIPTFTAWYPNCADWSCTSNYTMVYTRSWRTVTV
jgi:hypothetical protein